MALRVMTLNLWGINQWAQRRRAVAAWLAELQPDLVALQEVWCHGEDCQAEWLAAEVGMTASFAPSFTRDERRFGNAVLSRLPIVAEHFVQLPSGAGRREPRGLVSVEVEAGGGRLLFSSTHLSHLPSEGWVREAQAVAIVDAIHSHTASPGASLPPVLCGDMNSTDTAREMLFLTGATTLEGRRSPLIDAYRLANPSDPGVTWSHRNPHVGGSSEKDRRIDFILVGEPRADRAGRVLQAAVTCDQPRHGVWPSDHFGVIATLADP